jgi:hypothetical protein
LPNRKSSLPRLATKPSRSLHQTKAQQKIAGFFFGAYNPTSFPLKT